MPAPLFSYTSSFFSHSLSSFCLPSSFSFFSLFLTFFSLCLSAFLPQCSLFPQTCLRALRVSASPTDCPLSWECGSLSPLTSSSSSSASFSCLAGDRIRRCSAPGSSRPLGFKTGTWLTLGPGAEQLIRLNLALDLVEIWTLFGEDRWCLPCLFVCCYKPVSLEMVTPIALYTGLFIWSLSK